MPFGINKSREETGLGKEQAYTIRCEQMAQPVLHGDASKGVFQQRVKLLIPNAPTKKTKVLFIMGLEEDLGDQWLITPYQAFGAREDMVILCAEHRGYGTSIFGEDQSFPDYISISETLADYHAVREAYAAQLSGDWILYGCSYGGGLVIQYAHSYPGDGKVLLCSSGVVDWNAMLPEYDLAVRENIGQALYERLCEHIDHLTPAEPFGENWYSRELLYAFATGLGQFREYQSMLPMVHALAKLPTGLFIGLVKCIDVLFTGRKASYYAISNKTRTLTRAQAETCRYSWRVWRYEQAFLTGTFWAPAAARSIYRRSEADWIAECTALFGRAPTVFDHGTGWNVRAMVPELKIPMVYVRGARDPWRRVGLAPDDPIPVGEIINIEDGYHGPERYADVGVPVFQTVMKYL